MTACGRCASKGSSPHARGLRMLPVNIVGVPVDHPRTRGVYQGLGPGRALDLRIIPARAGFTAPRRRTPSPTRDHPRTRGVYPYAVCDPGWGQGSSPHARGLRSSSSRPPRAPGIIPARAGFTRSRPRQRGGGRDHPRTRGVYTPPPDPSPTITGSSPHARGLLGDSGRLIRGVGIIPARAGFTA